MYGVTPADHRSVKEIRCIVLVPQIGTYQSCSLPHHFPDHPYLKDMEPLGWIHTQPSETGQLSPIDAAMHARLLEDNQGWDTESAVIATCSFIQGSCSLSVYRLSPEGLEWARANKEKGA